MITQICAILFLCSILSHTSLSNVILEGIGHDEISGYILSPVTGISKIHLHRKMRRQVNLHIPLIPYVEEEGKKKKMSPISEEEVKKVMKMGPIAEEDADEDLRESPMSESFFQIDDD